MLFKIYLQKKLAAFYYSVAPSQIYVFQMFYIRLGHGGGAGGYIGVLKICT
jgi:hypothetical protein